MKKYNRVMQKLDNDYVAFRKSMTELDSNDVYDYAYKIYCVEEIYELLTNGYEFTSRMIRSILMHRGNILLHIYNEWIDYETNQYEEFCMFVNSCLKDFSTQNIARKCA